MKSNISNYVEWFALNLILIIKKCLEQWPNPIRVTHIGSHTLRSSKHTLNHGALAKM